MKRTDLKIERERITIHPEKLEAVKREARTRICSDDLSALWDTILDEELELHVDEIVAAGIAEEMRAEVKSLRGIGARFNMLNFRNFVEQLEGTNVQHVSVEADVRESVLAAMDRVEEIHATFVNDKFTSNGQ